MPALLLYSIVLVAFGSGAATYAHLDKTVHVSVDGQQRTVHTFARTVAAVLDHAHITTNDHDVVEPATSTHVTDGAQISVTHGRPLRLQIDGRAVTVWVTADTVQQALSELGLTESGTYVSASMSRPVPLSGLGLVVRVPHTVNVLHDGRATRILTTAATVREAIAVAKVHLAKSDKVSVRLDSRPYDGEVISVTRINTSHITVTDAIPFTTKQIADSSLYKGTVHVVSSGRVGVLVLRYSLVKVNGSLKTRKLVSRTVERKPETRVVRVGTKEKPEQTGNVGNKSVDDLNWYALSGCESGHNPSAYSPKGPYYGLYQFLQSSWELVGGHGDPRNASSNEQTYRAKLLYMRSGDGNWPNCGHYLYS